MGMSKSTYYYEIKKADVVKERNKELMAEIQEIFDYNKGRFSCFHYQLKRPHIFLQKSIHFLNLLQKKSRACIYTYSALECDLI